MGKKLLSLGDTPLKPEAEPEPELNIQDKFLLYLEGLNRYDRRGY